MKYVPGPAFGQLSGSQGNTTASHNRFGAYVRNRTIPVNPDTTAQVTARGRLTTLSALWRTLTEEQRGDWAGLGAQMQRVDSLGVAYNLTGLQAFNSVNGLRLASGESTLLVAPALGTLPEILTLVPLAEVDGDAFTVAYTATPLAAGVRMQIWATREVSPGRNFFGPREYRLIQTTAAGAASPANILAAYEGRFGQLTIGSKISVRARLITSTFIAGPWKRADTIVVTGA